MVFNFQFVKVMYHNDRFVYIEECVYLNVYICVY